MQDILSSGIVYLYINVCFLDAYVDEQEFLVRLTKDDDCVVRTFQATSKICEETVKIEFEISKELEECDEWKLEILDKDTKDLLHKIKVIVYKK